MKVSVIDLGFIFYQGSQLRCQKKWNVQGVPAGRSKGQGWRGAKSPDGLPFWNTSWKRTIDALKMFRDIIDFDSIEQVLPVATSVVREAGNKDDFLKQIYNQTGFQFKVLSLAKKKAWYSYAAGLRATCMPTTLFFLIPGGGSQAKVNTENYNIKKDLVISTWCTEDVE